MHRIEVFQLNGNNLFQVGFGISSAHLNCFRTIINFYENTIICFSTKYLFDETKRNLHQTIISKKQQDFQAVYIYTKQQFNRTMDKVNYNRIKAVLAEKNVSSKELAKHLNKTESTVSRWCTNDVQPAVEVFYQVALFLEVDIRDLFVSTKND